MGRPELALDPPCGSACPWDLSPLPLFKSPSPTSLPSPSSKAARAVGIVWSLLPRVAGEIHGRAQLFRPLDTASAGSVYPPQHHDGAQHTTLGVPGGAWSRTGLKVERGEGGWREGNW